MRDASDIRTIAIFAAIGVLAMSLVMAYSGASERGANKGGDARNGVTPQSERS